MTNPDDGDLWRFLLESQSILTMYIRLMAFFQSDAEAQQMMDTL